jgi:hypothetical protein
MAVASVIFIVYIVGFNRADYRASLLPHRYRKSLRTNSLRKLRRNEGENEKFQVARKTARVAV